MLRLIIYAVFSLEIVFLCRLAFTHRLRNDIISQFAILTLFFGIPLARNLTPIETRAALDMRQIAPRTGY